MADTQEQPVEAQETKLESTAQPEPEATAPTSANTASNETGAAPAAFEVDVDLTSSDVGMYSSPVKKKKQGKTLSILGTNLSNKPATAGGQQPCSPSSGKMSKAIAHRYSYEVREADRNRKLGYLPMEKQSQFMPTGHDIARDMQTELSNVTNATGGAHLVSKGVGWDAIMGNDTFQKRLQFLQEYAKTGNFSEKYGEEGMYEGDFMHGMRHGKGKYEFRKEVYEGEWKWDQRHGRGTLKCSDGTSIKGDFQNGRPHGFATVVDQKGTVVYEGEFKDGKRHGLGRQLFDSGDMYDGGWQQGRLHDRGVYYFTNGDRLYGMWQEGTYHGVGVFHYADGSISRREYSNGTLMSVQDYEHATKRFGKVLTRGGMQKHTKDRDFPKEVFLLNAV